MNEGSDNMSDTNHINGLAGGGSVKNPMGPGSTGGGGTPPSPGYPTAAANGDASKEKQTLSDIARGIQHAVNTSQEMLEQHYLRMLGRYFDKGNNAKMVRIKVPPDSVMEVPLIALMSPTGMLLEELVLDLSLRIDETDIKKTRKPDGKIVERTSFVISVGGGKKVDGKSKDTNEIDIRMVFKIGDPPEGIARIVDEFTKKIVPKKIVPKPQTEQDKWQV